MSVPAPHFLLFSESRRDRTRGGEPAGRWRFVLEAVDGSSKLAAADEEPEVGGDRLELLAVVRGLEALDQPSRVTLVTPSKYVSRGIRYGLDEWRDNGWRWERFGKMAPVKNGDLWRRVDRALKYHKVECRTWRLDRAEDDLAKPSRRGEAAGWASRSEGSAGCMAGGWFRRLSQPFRKLTAWRRAFPRGRGAPVWAAAG